MLEMIAYQNSTECVSLRIAISAKADDVIAFDTAIPPQLLSSRTRNTGVGF
jgi:hypothetical protein